MPKRYGVNRRRSQKQFRSRANRTHKMNKKTARRGGARV